MRDRGLILIGLIVFLALITLPITWNLAAGRSPRPPDLKLPANEKQCVAPTEYMRAAHMDLLLSWRDDATRRNVREFKAFNGRTYEISLTRTCLMQCHTEKAEFCDRCHNYAGVQGPYCMDCHIDPKLVARRSR